MNVNGAQLHMLVNHLPVVGFVGMIPALTAAIVVQSLDIKRFVLLCTVVVGASAVLANWTGDGAEEAVEHLAGIDGQLIHAHEELADVATSLALVTAVAAAGLWFLQRRRPGAFQVGLPVVLTLALVSAGVMGATAHAGGKIRHPELSPNLAAIQNAAVPGAKPQKGKAGEDKDDD